MSTPEVYIFRSASQVVVKNNDGKETQQCQDENYDKINLRVIDNNIYMAFTLSLVDTRVLIKNLQHAVDTKLSDTSSSNEQKK